MKLFPAAKCQWSDDGHRRKEKQELLVHFCKIEREFSLSVFKTDPSYSTNQASTLVYNGVGKIVCQKSWSASVYTVLTDTELTFWSI